MPTTDYRPHPAPRRSPEEAEAWAAKVWRRCWIGFGAFLLVVFVWGLLGSDRSPEYDPARDPEHQRYLLCERAARENGLDPDSEAGLVAVGRCMEQLAP